MVGTLEHSTEMCAKIDEVIVSSHGRYVITRMSDDSRSFDPHYWPLLKDDKLWDVASGECIYTLQSNLHIAFSPKDDKVAFFHCRSYYVYDWSLLNFDLVIYGLEGEYANKSHVVRLPEGDVIGDPVITESGDYLCALMQVKDKAVIGSKSSSILNTAELFNAEQESSRMSIVLVV